MKLHPAVPEGYRELPPSSKLRVAGIIAGREFLYGFLEYLESGVRLLGTREDRQHLAQKSIERDTRIQSRVDEYLEDRNLLPDRPL